MSRVSIETPLGDAVIENGQWESEDNEFLEMVEAVQAWVDEFESVGHIPDTDEFSAIRVVNELGGRVVSIGGREEFVKNRVY